MQDEARKGTAFELAAAVWSRRKWLAIICFAAPFAAVVSLVTSLPKIYQSTATVVVERQQVPEAFVRSTVTDELGTRLQTISQEVLSRARLDAMITRFDLYSHLRKQAPLEEVIERMRRDIKLELKEVEHRGGRRAGQAAIAAFTVSYRGSDPRTVALVTNALTSFYVEENLKVRERQATGTAEFLRVQLEEITKRLDAQERRVGEFKKRYIGELPQQLQANLTTLERLNVQHRMNGENQIRAQERRDALDKQLAESDPSAPTEGPDAPTIRIARLRQELTSLRGRFSDKYPEVVRVKTEIAALERQLAETASGGNAESEAQAPVSPQILRLKQALNEVESEIRVLKAEEKHLRSSLGLYQSRVENTPRREQELQEMSRDYETTRTLYNSLLTRHEEAQLAESLEQRQKGEQFRVLDPAVPSGAPVAPKRSRLLLVGLLLSLGMAACAVVLSEQLDTSFHTVDDLRAATTVPVLVGIPRIVTETDASRSGWRFRIALASVMLGLALIVGASYFIAQGNEELVWMLARSGS